MRTIDYSQLSVAARGTARLYAAQGATVYARAIGRGHRVEAGPKNHPWAQVVNIPETVFPENTKPEPAEENSQAAGFELVPLDLIDPNPYQPRMSQDAEALKSLARGLMLKRKQLPATCGLMQVPIARPLSSGRYELAFGHRRWSAFRLLYEQANAAANPNERFAWSKMPLRLVALDDEQMYDYAARENGDRKEINPIEKALSIKRAQDELGWSLSRAANAHGLSKSAGSNLTRLLQLPAAVRQMIAAGEMSQRHGRELVRLMQYEPPLVDDCHEIARRAIEHEMNVATVGRTVDNFIEARDRAKQLQAEAEARAAHRENRYCRTCGAEREFTGAEVDRNKAVDCSDCGYNGPPAMWLREPRRCAACGALLTMDECINQMHNAHRCYCKKCQESTVGTKPDKALPGNSPTTCATCGATEPGGAWYHDGDTWLCARCSPYNTTAETQQQWPASQHREILRQRFYRLTRRLDDDELDILAERLRDIEAEFSANWDLRE